MDSKIVITGTGRCGTSFLMQLLTRCGVNTGYTIEEADEQVKRIQGLNAGIEHGTYSERIESARVIKNPEWIRLEEFQKLQDKYTIDHVIIPFRDVTAAAKSREYMHKNTHGGYGGYWLGAENVEQQMMANSLYFCGLLQYLLEYEIPYTLISFENMMSDKWYLFKMLPEELKIGEIITEYDNIIDKSKIRF